MKFLITGASSSVGQEIYKKLQNLGYEVNSVDTGQTKKWRLGDPLPPSGADTLIHLAHDRGLSIEVTDIDDLVNEIVFVINSKVASPIFAAHHFPISLHELLKQISRKEKLSNRFILMPIQPFDIVLRVMSKLFTKFSILDSVLSISKSVSYTELSKLVLPNTKFKKFGAD